MAKTKEKEFDWATHAEDVKAAREEAAQASLEPVSDEITESEWQLMLQRRGQDDADRLFAIIAEHGAVNIVADPEPEEEESAVDETYAGATQEKPAAKAETKK